MTDYSDQNLIGYLQEAQIDPMHVLERQLRIPPDRTPASGRHHCVRLPAAPPALILLPIGDRYCRL